MKTDDEIKEIAQGILNGQIFCDRMIRPEEFEQMATSIFMSIGLMGLEQWEEFKKQDIGMVYEYLDKASPRAINGYPIFFSAHILTKADAKRVYETMKLLAEASKAVKVPG